MKQAWGWLIAAVVAAGLNASYHDGGLRMIHEVAARAGHNAQAVLALATGQADQFMAQAQLLAAGQDTSSCRLATTLARVQSRLAGTETRFDRFEVRSFREQAQLAKFDVKRARIEAKMAHLRMPPAAFHPMVFSGMQVSPACPRVRVNLPKAPVVKIPPTPVIHIETGLGPV